MGHHHRALPRRRCHRARRCDGQGVTRHRVRCRPPARSGPAHRRGGNGIRREPRAGTGARSFAAADGAGGEHRARSSRDDPVQRLRRRRAALSRSDAGAVDRTIPLPARRPARRDRRNGRPHERRDDRELRRHVGCHRARRDGAAGAGVSSAGSGRRSARPARGARRVGGHEDAARSRDVIRRSVETRLRAPALVPRRDLRV